MAEYVHGGNAAFEEGGEGLLDLSASINPLGPPEAAMKAVIDCLADCAAYPDHACRALRKQIGAHENVPPEWIFCGAGASDVLFRLPRCISPGKAWTLAPTFAEYERAARSAGAKMAYYPLAEENGFAMPPDALAHLALEKPDLVFLCNPNNPTGLLTPREQMEEMIAHCQRAGAIIAIDECFMDFVEDAPRYSALPLTERYENLVVIRAFTKIFAMPGLRLGYAVTRNRRLLEGLAWHGPDWPVSVPAQAAGLAALRDAEPYIARTVQRIAAERARLSGALRGLGYSPFDSRANYLFFRSRYPFDLHSALNAAGIRIRACANYRGLSGAHYRVAVSTEENGGVFLRAMREVTPWPNR